MKSLRTLLANVKVGTVAVEREEKMDKREIVLGAKFESGILRANAVISDVIDAMCGDTIAMEEAMEKALEEKAQRISRRQVKIAKAVRVPVNKRANGKETPKAPQNRGMRNAAKRNPMNEVRVQNIRNARSVMSMKKKIEFMSKMTHLVRYGFAEVNVHKYGEEIVNTINTLVSLSKMAKTVKPNFCFSNHTSIKMNVQLLARNVYIRQCASDSEVTSTNNKTKEGSLMRMNIQMLSRQVSKTAKSKMEESLVRLSNLNFYNTNNPDVVATLVNKVINEVIGLTPMVTIATKDGKVKNDKEKGFTLESGSTTVSLGLMTRQRNRFNRGLGEFARLLTKYSIGGNTMTFTEQDLIIDEYVVLKADSASIGNYAEKVFYVDFEKKQGIFAIQTESGFVNLLNGETLKKGQEEKLNQYIFLGASASALRPKFGFYGGVLVKIKDAKTGATRSTNDVINDKCDGLMDYAKETYTEIEAAKFATRHMQYDTPSVSMGSLGKVAKLNGKFDTTLMTLIKTSNGFDTDFEKGGGTFDGVVYMPVSFVAEMFKCKKSVAMQLSLQARPGSLKVQVQVLEDDAFYLLLKQHKNLGNITTHGKGKKVSMLFDINAQKAEIDLSNLELEVLKLITKKPSNPSKGMLEKVVIAALEDDLVNGRDINKTNSSYKTVMLRMKKLGLQGIVENLIVDILGGKKLGVSDLSNISAICNKGANVVPAAVSGEVKNALKSVQNGINKLSFGKDIVDYLTITTDMGMLFGIKILSEGEIYIPSKKKSKKVDRIIAIKYPTMGMKEFYSANIIKLDEIERRIDNAEMPELIKIAFGSKADEEFSKLKELLKKNYKTMSDALVVLPASMDVFNSCAGLDVDTDAMAIVYDDVIVDTLFGKEELIKLGALKMENNECSMDKEDEELLEQIENDALNSDKLSADQKANINRALNNKYLYTSDPLFFAKAYINATRGNTESIGSISNSNSRIIALYAQVLMGKMEGFANFFKENFGAPKADSKKEYKGLIKHAEERADGKVVYFVDEDVIDAIIEEAKEMDVTNPNNAIELLKDVNRVFRFYQEKTIDMAKTGGTIRIRFSCKSVVVSSLVDCEVIDIDLVQGGTFNFKLNKEMPELKELDIRIYNKNGEKVEEFKLLQIVVNDPMSEVQDTLVKASNKKMNDLIKQYKVLTFQQMPQRKGGIVDDYAILTETSILDKDGNEINIQYYDMSKALDKAHNAILGDKLEDGTYENAYLLQGLYTFKKIYKELAKEFALKVNKLDAKDDEALIEVHRNQFKAKLDWISNSCEYMLSCLNSDDKRKEYVTKGMAMLAIASKSNPGKTVNPNSTNKFALNVCSHYAACYALNTNIITAECKIVECDKSLVGQTVELVNGMSADMKLVVKDRFKTDKVTVEVVEKDGEIKVLYTEKIVAPEHNKDIASLVFETKIINAVNAEGKMIVDAGGNARRASSNALLQEILEGEYKTLEFKEEEEVFILTKEDGVQVAMEDEELFMDIELDTVYNIGSSFLTGEGEEGLVSIELTK